MKIISDPPQDVRLLIGTRMMRLFAYGFLSVILALYLNALGLGELKIGLLLTATLVGDTLISLWMTTRADRAGRRRMLIVGAFLMTLAAGLFTLTQDFYLLLMAGTIGVVSPSGGEVGPFLSIEQASLSQLVSDRRRTGLFAWYNLVGSFATATGALAGGGLSQLLQETGYTAIASYRAVLWGYGLIALVLMGLFRRLSSAVEVPDERRLAGADSREPRRFLGMGRSRGLVLRLSALFSFDAFAGGFIVQSLLALWFSQRFGVEPAVLGAIFFGANILAGVSALTAARIAARIGLIRTMVYTHLPANALLILLPFVPTLPLAIALLLIRSTISQMDVPTRQSYVMAVVTPEERSAASGVTNVARTVGASLSPVLAGALMSSAATLALPFVIAGGLKIIYDLSLYYQFRNVRPPEES